jgi:hypothetical protein
MAADSPKLEAASLQERHDAAVIALREHPNIGPVLLSYVVWPADAPQLAEIDAFVRLQLRKRQREMNCAAA